MNAADLLLRGEPGAIAIVDSDGTLDYAALRQRVGRAATLWAGMGVRPGERCIVGLPDGADWVAAFLGLIWMGGIPVAISPRTDIALIRELIVDAGAIALLLEDETAAAVADARALGLGAWRRLLERTAEAVPLHEAPADAPAFWLNSSGTTGKPKGIVHTSGGYLTQAAATTKYVFDLREEDIFWCTADVGWVTGHSYVVYGPLANGATVLMYEGAPDWPERDRFWKLIARHGVTVFYTAPTAIRAFMKWGTSHPAAHDLSTLRLLGTVGEPINPEAWMWYHEHVGRGNCPIVDTWWQTETGGIMITALPGVTTTKPGSATTPFPGISVELVDTTGKPMAKGGGFLTLTEPWPGMLRTIYGDDARYRETYWSRFPGRYFAGDGAKVDDDGYWWLLGRVDDVLNVAGHRIGTMEVESALVDHPSVAEAAVVGKAHELKGQAISAFVTVKEGVKPSAELRDDLREHVAKKIGAIAKPDDILFSADLPKTRSGKIMRRLLKEICGGGQVKGDTTTLEDFSVVASLAAQSGKDED